MALDRDDVMRALRGKTTQEDRADAIMELIDDEAPLIVVHCSTRAVSGEVEAYGLTIELDAAGMACSVEFPRGAWVE